MSISRRSNRVFRTEAEDAAKAQWDARQEWKTSGIAARGKARAVRTPEQQLMELDGRPGCSRRERSRLNGQMAKAS